MLDYTGVPKLYEWVKNNTRLAIVLATFMFFGYVGYQFVGGYASALGQSMVGEYGKFRRSVSSYTAVDIVLANYLDVLQASRVAIVRFHDSVRDIGNNSVFYVDYESMVTAPGVTSRIEDLRNISAITFAPIIPKLLQGKPVFLWVKDLPPGSLKEMLQQRGDKALLCVPVNDLKDHLVGMVAVSWLYEKAVPVFAQRTDLMEQLARSADKIGAYFSASEAP